MQLLLEESSGLHRDETLVERGMYYLRTEPSHTAHLFAGQLCQAWCMADLCRALLS